MNRQTVIPGKYLYCRMVWDKSLTVYVEEQNGKMVCLFFNRRQIVPLSEIPVDANFKPFPEDEE